MSKESNTSGTGLYLIDESLRLKRIDSESACTQNAYVDVRMALHERPERPLSNAQKIAVLELVKREVMDEIMEAMK